MNYKKFVSSLLEIYDDNIEKCEVVYPQLLLYSVCSLVMCQSLDRGIYEFLINILFHQKDSPRIIDYIPRLTQILVNKKFNNLKKLLEYIASKSTLAYLLQSNSLNTVVEKEISIQQSALHDSIDQLVFNIQINFDDLPKQTNSLNYEHNIIEYCLCLFKNDVDEMSIHQIKLQNQLFQEWVNSVIDLIGSITISLKNHPREERNKVCHQTLCNLNKYQLTVKRKEQCGNQLTFHIFRGIIMPLSWNNQMRMEQIVNIKWDESIVFSTKNRCPFKLVVEVVDINEFFPFENIKFQDKVNSRKISKDDENSTNGHKDEKQNQLSRSLNYPIINQIEIEPHSKIYKTESIHEGDISKLYARREDLISIEHVRERSLSYSEFTYHALELTEDNFNKSLKIFNFHFDFKKQIFKNNLYQKYDEIKGCSQWKDQMSQKIRELIVKEGDDLKQEDLASKLMQKLNDIFELKNIKLHLKTCDVQVHSLNQGFISYVSNTVSLDQIKRHFSVNERPLPLSKIYELLFMDDEQKCQENFLKSLAAQSLFTQVFQVKDRHNGNILIDIEGHLVHIDFGYLLTNSPQNLNFESRPFKLTEDYVEMLGGLDGDLQVMFKHYFAKGFWFVREYVEDLVSIIYTFYSETDKLPCFQRDTWETELRARLLSDTQLDFDSQEYKDHIERLFQDSYNSFRTNNYDQYQKLTNDINY